MLLGKMVAYRTEVHWRYPAVITCVHSPSCVNLHVFGDGTHGPPNDRMPTSVMKGDGLGEWSELPEPTVEEPRIAGDDELHEG